MPAPTSLTEQFDTLYSTTWQLMRQEAIDNIFNATPLTFWLHGAGDRRKSRIRREAGGRWIGVQLMYAKNTTVKTIGPGGVVDLTPVDPITTARYDWKILVGSVVRNFVQDDRMNVGQAQIMRIIETKFQNLQLSMIDALESQFFGDGTGNGGLDFDGLQNLVSTTAGQTVGGINSSTHTWWDNKRKTYVAADGIRKNLTNLYNTLSIGNDHPTFIVTTQTVYELYEDSLSNILRVYDNRFGDVGFEALGFKGAALTFSPSCPTGNAYLLNERYLQLVVEQNTDFVMTEWKPVPNQLERAAQVVFMANLVTSNRRMQGVLTGIA